MSHPSSAQRQDLRGAALAASQRKFSILAAFYVHLWILEGAIRKWVPGMESIFYVARDVTYLCGLALILGSSRGSFLPRDKFRWPIIYFTSLIAILAVSEVITNIISLPVALAGIRTYIAPLLLVLGASLFGTNSLWLRLSRIVSFYAPPMAILVVIQVLSPPQSPINKETLSDIPRFINGTIVRALGTFSAPAGLAAYVPLALGLSLALLMISTNRRDTMKAYTSTFSCIAMAALGGTRLTVLGCISIVAVFLLCLARRARSRTVIRFGLLITGIAVATVTFWAYITPVLESFAERFAQASVAESSSGRLWEQSFGFLTYPLTGLGNGIGSHTLAGINLGSPYSWVEWDTEKWVAEMGILGLGLAIVRVWAAIKLGYSTIRTISHQNWVAIMSATALVPVMFYGQLTQLPSNHAFFSIACTILLSSWNSGPPHVCNLALESSVDRLARNR